MTKYILHGGNTSKSTNDNKQFFYEMTIGKKPINILCVCFSQPENSWDYFYQKDQLHFIEGSPYRTINFACASNDNDIFITQIKKADVIYIRGSKTIKLLEKLKTVTGFAEAIQDKVVSGSAAGACILGQYYYTGNSNSVITQ